MANQKESHPFTISDWFRPRYEPNVCLVERQRDFQSRGEFFLFSLTAGRTGVPSDFC